jgi:hypothetical protein
MHRGRIEITTDPICYVDDVLIGSCGTVGFALIDLDDSSAGSADFSFALDAIGRVAITAKTCSIEVLAAYRGDTELKAIGFSADLLIYRPGLARP